MSRLEYYKTRKKIPNSILITGIIASIMLCVLTVGLLLYPFPSQEKVNYFTKQHPIIINMELTDFEALKVNGEFYIPYTFIKKYVDSDVSFDKPSSSVIISTEKNIVKMPTDHLEYFMNDQAFQFEIPSVTIKGETPFLSISLLKKLYSVKIDVSSETGAITVLTPGQVILPAIVQNNHEIDELRLRIKPKKTAPYTDSVVAGETVMIVREDSNFYFVLKENGVAGFVDKNVLSIQQPYTITEQEFSKKTQLSALQWPINLTWEAIYSKEGSLKEYPQLPGVNVVSPTWFALKNNEGDLRNLASEQYMNWANEHGYHVWALFSNDFDPKRTHEVLMSFENRQKVIKQLIQYSQIYGFQGINVDFENVNYEDRKLVTQFVKELTSYAHQLGLIVSMDITFISRNENWSKFYEREKLANIVDYMVVMAYDEHWQSSPVAGSVSSFQWVEKNLGRLLKVVPSDRLILGIPLYSYLWKEELQEDGTLDVSAKAISMEKAQSWIEEKGITPTFDEDSGQYYAEYIDKDEQVTYKLWIEDAASIYNRAQFVHKYQLAGVASWSRYFASDEVWDVLADSLQRKKVVKK
jgi:spore germination protein YaaH